VAKDRRFLSQGLNAFAREELLLPLRHLYSPVFCLFFCDVDVQRFGGLLVFGSPFFAIFATRLSSIPRLHLFMLVSCF